MFRQLKDGSSLAFCAFADNSERWHATCHVRYGYARSVHRGGDPPEVVESLFWESQRDQR